MKTFFKQVLAVVVGMLIVSAFTFLMGFIMLGAMLSAGDSKPVIKNGSVLRINLSGNLQERVQENPVSAFLGMSGTEEQGLDNILKSIKIAATNDKISGIYLESGIFSADMASLEEIRKALTDFKKAASSSLPMATAICKGPTMWPAWPTASTSIRAACSTGTVSPRSRCSIRNSWRRSA